MNIRKILAAVAVLAVVAFTQAAHAQDTFEITKTISLDKDGKVYIDNYKGTIDVDTWDSPEVKVTARVEPDGFTREDRESVKHTEIRFDSSASSLRIETDYHEMQHDWTVFDWFDEDRGNRALVHYTITMPAGARLSIKDYKSGTKISRLHADLHIDTYKGSVSVINLSGAMDFQTYKGDMRVSYEKISGENRIKDSKGIVNIEMPADAGFAVSADFGSRVEFTSEFDGVEQKHSRRSQSVEGKVNDGSASLDLESEKGEVHLLKRKSIN